MLDPRRIRVGSTGSALNAAYVVGLPASGVAFDKIRDKATPFFEGLEAATRLKGGELEREAALSKLVRMKELDACVMEGRVLKAGFIGDGIGDVEGESTVLRRE